MNKRFLVCIDSDGCAFDTMEIKHKECFCPSYINYFGLQAVSKYARDAWDFVNLYSCFRGMNRFVVLLKSLELLSERKEVLERNFVTPTLDELRKYVAEGRPQLVIAIGCTGGQHRSVTTANCLYEALASDDEYGVKIYHRDIGK